jgi:hypothetical protein
MMLFDRSHELLDVRFDRSSQLANTVETCEDPERRHHSGLGKQVPYPRSARLCKAATCITRHLCKRCASCASYVWLSIMRQRQRDC